MGDTLHIEVHETRTDPGPGDDNSTTLRLMGWLDSLSERLGVAKLSAFYDNNRALADGLEWMRQDVEEGLIAESEMPAIDPAWLEPQWFDSGPALAAVQALVTHLERCPDDLGFRPDASTAHWPEQLMDELRGLASALSEAVRCEQPFRFYTVS